MRLYEDQHRAMYLDGTATDDRLDDVLDELRPLPEIDTEADEEELQAVIRNVVRDELNDVTRPASGDRTTISSHRHEWHRYCETLPEQSFSHVKMADQTTDRFTVLIGPEDLADHILDMADVQLDEELEERKQRLPDEALEKLDEVVLDGEFEDVLLSLGWSLPGELMCSHGTKSYATDLVSLSEYAAERGLDEIDFDGDAPEGLCSYCWSNTRKTLDEEAEFGAEGVYNRIGTVSYRLRWKQKGRAREEWYDIVVRPETTMAELDRLVCRFSTLDDFHLRMYGLEDEYLDSSIRVVPDQQHSANPSNTRASEITIAEVAERASLWEGDRLSLVYDFGTPAHFYCIVKEIYEPAELDSLLAETDLSAETETAAIVDQKRP